MVHGGAVTAGFSVGGGVGIAHFNLTTPGGNTPEVRLLLAYYILPYYLKTKSI